MTDTQIFGRDTEVAQFKKILDSNEAEFIAVYGRRRIGKTYLIHQYFHNKGLYFEFTGLHQATLTHQLKNFSIAFSDVFKRGIRQATPSSWLEALTLLRKEIEKVPSSKKIILFFDELPWLATSKSGFMQALELFWNRYLSRMSNVILIVCGSAAAWMIAHVINNKGGLHGRLTQQIKLQPFNLTEAENYLHYRGIKLTRKQFIEIYMAIGGVAKYLNHVSKNKSSTQIINEICFNQNGYLYKEFHKLYQSLFDSYFTHITIIKALAQKKSGLTREEILKKTALASGGTFTKALNELNESGFILKIAIIGHGKQKIKYLVADYYSLFYLKWIEKAIDNNLNQLDKDYWIKCQNQSAWNNWAGHSFENICLHHIQKIKDALGISSVSINAASWQNKNAQIDLVIDRADQCINLCEIKFHNQEVNITQDYAKKLLQKKNEFTKATKTKKAIFMTLITVYGAKENQQYHSIIDNQLTIDSLF